MYTLEAFERKVGKEGATAVIQQISSPNLPAHIKDALSKNKILIDGKPNRELIFSLVA